MSSTSILYIFHSDHGFFYQALMSFNIVLVFLCKFVSGSSRRNFYHVHAFLSMLFPNEDASPWLRMSHVSEFNELDAKCLLLVFFFSWNSQ